MLKANKAIYDISPYIGGESGKKAAQSVIKLSSNEGPFGPPPSVVRVIQESAAQQHLYPDGSCHDLRHALAAKNKISVGNIVCGAGSDELISLLCQAYVSNGDEVLYSQYGFLMYPISTRAAGGTPLAVPEKNMQADIDGLLAAVTPKTKIVFLANPNNPTGALLKRQEIERLHRGLPEDVLLVIDAAYAEFVDDADYTDGHEWVESSKNLVVTRTFSKLYGMGGLRLGWCHAPDHVVDILNRVRGPFNVSAIAQVAGLAALADRDFLDMAKAHNKAGLKKTVQALTAMGLSPFPSAGNFVLVDCGSAARADHILQFLKDRFIFVRQMGGYGLPACLRISIGTDAQMDQCLSVIEESLKNV